MEFHDFDSIFGKARAECSSSDSVPLHPFLFHAHAPDSSCIRIVVTDFHSSTWEVVRSIQQLDDMRDSIGISGTWTEFVNYVIASLKSEAVKVVLDGHSQSDGGTIHAKLVAQKSKGLPLLVFYLTKLMDSVASGAISNMCFNLFNAFEKTKKLLLQEKTRSNQLTKVISSDQDEKGSILEGQLDLFSNRQKLQKIDSLDIPHMPVNLGSVVMSDKVVGSSKMQNRGAIPTHRRLQKVRGALLHDDTEADIDKSD